MSITVRATFRVLPERDEEFTHAAAALAEAARDEAGTLRYDWYTSADPTEYVVLEEYTDTAAALAHNERCSTLIKQVSAVAEMTSAHLHGVTGPELDAWIERNQHAHAHPPMQKP